MTARKLVISSELVVRRVICVFLSLLIILPTTYYLLPTTYAQAPSPTPTPAPTDGGTPISADNYKAPQHANYTILNLEHSLFCELTGTSPVDKCIGLNKDRKLSLYNQVPNGGAVGGLTNIMVAMYTHPPTSTAEYLADLSTNLGLIKPVYAQVGGSGAGIIEPIRILWQICRNISYVIFAVVFVITGFMIMFRAKISPQAVISIQQALPGLVIGLILVTFSYFLAALIIDTSFVGIQVASQVFIQVKDPAGKTINVLDVPALAKDSNALSLFASTIRLPENIKDVTTGVFSTVSSIFGGGAVGGAATLLIPAIIGGIIGSFVVPGIGTIIGAGTGLLATGIIGLIIPLILILALIIQFFKLLWKLVGAYIALLVTTIVGPFVILWASVPGKSGALGFWWKTLLGNALVFPAVFVAFLFAGLILDTDQSKWSASLPLFGGLEPQLLRLIIAYGLILGTPAIPDLVKKAIGAGDVGTLAQQGLAGFMGGAGAVGAGYSQLPVVRSLRREREIYQRGGGLPAAGWRSRIIRYLPFLAS